MWANIIKSEIRILCSPLQECWIINNSLGSSDNNSPIDPSTSNIIVMNIKYSINFDSTKDVVDCLEIDESNSTNILRDSSVSSIHVADEILIVSDNYWI